MPTTQGLPEFSLAGKVILVSGAARGLGLTQAEALLEAGARVYALDRLEEPSPDFAPISERAKKDLGTSLEYRQIDVRDVKRLHEIVQDIADKEGRLDGLIAAAGIQQETTALEYTAEDANRMFEVNITGSMMTAQAAAKQMIRFGSGGSIVLIASMSGTVANRGLICSAYNASKAGVLQLARNLASEWGEHNIRVNTISPGYIVTAMVEELFKKFPERRETWPTQNMLGRLSKPEEYRVPEFTASCCSVQCEASEVGGQVWLRLSAGYAAYIIYNTLQSPGPGDGLHRSNAVRRRRPRDSPPAPALPLSEQDLPVLGEHDILGTSVLLDPHNLITPPELRDIILNAQPDASEETIQNATGRLYDEFFDRLLVVHSPDRALSPPEADALRAWLSDRNPNNIALDRYNIARAATRHAQIFANIDNLGLDGGESVAPTELSLGSDDDQDDDVDPEGQTLQRTLYHIAEDRARLEGVVHRGITCNGCDEKPIRGTRWHCANCPDFDLCSNCEATNSHYKNHIFYKIRVPAGWLSLQKQEPIYPGKPHMMHPSIDSTLKRRLVAETKMEAEEIEALWDQFTCLAGTEWANDPSGVGWALDRRNFNHAYVPRYNGLVAAPNLVYDRIFAYYDTDKNGLIGFDEWVKGLDGMHTTDVDVKARIVFDGYDIDGDGYISRKDILRIFRAYYSIEKEATRNYILELSDEVNVRNAMDTIRSSQPLGSAFPPRSMNASNPNNPGLREKQENGEVTSPPILDQNADIAEREEILSTTDIHHIGPAPSDEQEARILNGRWARRHYYLDEEEGFTRRNGADGQNTSEELDQQTPADTNEEPPHSRGSRSSSRVRFQNDVELETRSNASSPRPVGERWGGYEIPEPEQDLGKEVLYQVTQQGFNELLNPLFLEKEDMAMDAYETRSERRAEAASIESTTRHLFTAGKADLEAIHHVGVFRFSKCMVDKFCGALNNDTKSFFTDPNHGGPRTENEARVAIDEVYTSVEAKVLGTIKNRKTTNLDNMTTWNTLLCRVQLREEAINAAMHCADTKGWLARPSAGEGFIVNHRDPTMPQFRPNSLAHPPSISPTASHSSSQTSEASETGDSSLLVDEGIDLGRCFFVSATRDGLERYPGRQRFTDETEMPDPGSASTPTAAIDLVEGSAEVESSSPPVEPSQKENEPSLSVDWRWYTDVPELHYFFTHNSNGVDVIQCSSNQHNHSTDSFHPETNQVRPLQRSIRQIAMHPASPLHLIMLASLESVEQEINERKDSGLINFDEFVEHMRQGQLRFLESWMEWAPRIPQNPKWYGQFYSMSQALEAAGRITFG
ncbi:ef hand domain-containing protein [Stemphylium lycopersici]|uniref:Ef hand domain-containing protein n=1 Tax=Stemphylium lycopersici TaxID=183478 RepID=A0A364MWI6_STELY|nr:ef hand domain-containing protein [Stemphylium lycopersici]